jgi:hypothetical protein
MAKLVCARCGYVPEWTMNDWGRDPETHGHGPDPICVALVDDWRFPALPNGEKPQRICQGTLVPQPGSSRKADNA